MNNFSLRFLLALISIVGFLNLPTTEGIFTKYLLFPIQIETEIQELPILIEAHSSFSDSNSVNQIFEKYCTRNFTFTSQLALDTFNCYCPTIEGDLIINGDDIFDLSNLSSIKTVMGNVLIGDSLNYSNKSLTSLKGLENVSIIGEDLIICNNDAMRNLDGFSSLMEVGGDIKINNCFNLEYIYFAALRQINGNCNYTNLPNLLAVGSEIIGESGTDVLTFLGGGLVYSNLPNLEWITGLSRLTHITNELRLFELPKLTNLAAFKAITHIGGSLNLTRVEQLVDLTGLDALECIGGNIRIIENEKITALNQFDDLRVINGSFNITNNPNLITLEGLRNLVSIKDTLLIHENDVLSNCCGINQLLLNDGVNGYTKISKNLAGCMGIEDIRQHCIENVADKNRIHNVGDNHNDISIIDNIIDAHYGSIIDKPIFDCPEFMANIGEVCDDNDPNTENEWLEEDCKCVGQIINGCNLTIQVEENSIIVDNVDDAHNKIYLWDRTFSNLIDSTCTYWQDCKGTKSISNLLPGTYAVQYQSFNEDWTKIFCDAVVYVDIAGSTTANTADCANINIQLKDNKLTIENLPTLNTIIDVYDSEYATIFHCLGDCGIDKAIEDLPQGDYVLRLKVYDTSWNFICEREEQFEMETSIGMKTMPAAVDRGRLTKLNVDKLKIFPNPAIESVHIAVDDLINEKISITVFNMFGENVQHHELDKVTDAVYRIDISGYDAGVYQVVISTNGRLLTGKVIILK